MKRIVQRLYIGIILLGLSAFVSAQAQDVIFLSLLDDVPLMAGLKEQDDTALYFDTPQGRIAEATAQGAPSVDEIMHYYLNSLPALGWHIDQAQPPLIFTREGEYLNIDIVEQGQSRHVRFVLSPNRP